MPRTPPGHRQPAQDAAAAAGCAVRLPDAAALSAVAMDARQEHLDRGAGTRFAGDPHRAAELRRDAVDLCQPQAAALADRLGGEERLEGSLQHIAGHAHAGIDHRDPHVIARIERSAERPRADARCPSRSQPAAIRHRVARVDREVEHDEFQLRRVDWSPATGRLPDRSPPARGRRDCAAAVHPCPTMTAFTSTGRGDRFCRRAIGQELLGELPAAQRRPHAPHRPERADRASVDDGSAAARDCRSPR